MGKATEGGDQRETWRDWQDKRAPEPPLLTRTEVLALLERWNIEPKVEERTLRYWEKEGLIPRPTREHRSGVTRTWYPSWVPDLIAVLRRRQRYKVKLATLRDELRAVARQLSTEPREHPFTPREGGDGAFQRYLAERAPHLLDGPRYPPLQPLDPPTLPSWGEYFVLKATDLVIRDQYQRHDFATTRIEVRLLDATGKARTYVVPLPDDFDLDPAGTALAATQRRIAAILADGSSDDHDAGE